MAGNVNPVGQPHPMVESIAKDHAKASSGVLACANCGTIIKQSSSGAWKSDVGETPMGHTHTPKSS